MTLPRVPIPRRVLRIGQIAICAALLAWLWHIADGPAAAQSLAGADPRWLLAALAALSLQTVLSASRWRLTAGQLGIRLGWWHALREYYLSQVINQSLPGGVIGDAGRALRARAQAGLLVSGQAVVFERLAGQIGLFAVMCVAFAATCLVPGGVEWPGWLLPVVLGLMAAGVALPVAVMVLTRLPGPPGRAARSFVTAFRLALCAPGVLGPHILLSLATTACNIAAFAFCAAAIGADLGWSAVAALVPLILFTMLIPLSVSGWGLREGAAAALFPLAGAASSDGLAASVAFGVTFIVAVLPGVIPLWITPQRDAVNQ